MKLFKNIIYYILSVQEKLLTKSLNKTLKIKNSSKRKKYYSNGCFISLDTIADSDKQKMEEELNLILKASNYDVKEIIKYIENHNTNVFFIDSAKYLTSIGENIGFIYPQKNFKALYISLLVNKGFTFKTNEMFIFDKQEINKYYFIYHFYNWYAFKHNIYGLDAKSQELLNKYLFNTSDAELKTLQLDDIYKLKDAIKQDKSAIEFVFKLCQNYDSAKNALQKLQNDGAKI